MLDCDEASLLVKSSETSVGLVAGSVMLSNHYQTSV